MLLDVTRIIVNFEKLTAAEKNQVSHSNSFRAVALVSYEANRHQEAKLLALLASTPVVSVARNASGDVASHKKKNVQSKN